MLSDANVLITGGAGFLGSNYAKHMLEHGNKVTILDNLSRGAGGDNNIEWLLSAPNSSKLTIIRADVRDYEAIEKAVKDKDVIIHAAAQVSVPVSVDNPALDFQTNIVGTFNVLESCRRSKTNPRIIYIGSNKVYGTVNDSRLVKNEKRYDLRDLPNGIDETFEISPLEPYGVSKASSEMYTHIFNLSYGLRTATLRFSLLYGPRQWGKEEQGFVAWFCAAYLLGLNINIFGDGKQVRDLLYVDDAVSAIDLTISDIGNVAGRSLNIGGGRENSVSLLELLDYLTEITGKAPRLTFKDWRENDVKCFYTNCEASRKTLGWFPKVNWKNGVRNVYDTLNQNLDKVKLLYK